MWISSWERGLLGTTVWRRAYDHGLSLNSTSLAVIHLQDRIIAQQHGVVYCLSIG